MKQFFKFVFATMVGIILISIIFIVIIIGILVAASGEKHIDVDQDSVLHINLNAAIPERTPHNPLEGLGFLGI
ncbi:MAG TPA: signal peptide peptidase SppA, partial [Mucilaginibacter sp.]|nr:signal peptide peptidase SppA [Mucilaginibacter sp.]